MFSILDGPRKFCSNADTTQIYATYGPHSFGISTEAEYMGTKAVLVETCSLAGSTEAVCSASISASANGQEDSTTTVVTKTGGNVHFFQVPITAGADRLSGLASCTSTGNAAAPTGMTDVYKVLVAPAAALLAGAAALV